MVIFLTMYAEFFGWNLCNSIQFNSIQCFISLLLEDSLKQYMNTAYTKCYHNIKTITSVVYVNEKDAMSSM